MVPDECCLVHGNKYRSQFQFILNFLRKTVNNKSLNFSKAPRIVCCCRLRNEAPSGEGSVKSAKMEDFITPDDLANAMSKVLSIPDFPANVKAVLEKWNKRSLGDGDHILYGNARIAALVILCHEGKFELLRNPVSENAMTEHTVILPMNPKLLGNYFGRSGRNIKEASKEHGFRITAGAKDSMKCASSDTTSVTVKCKEGKFKEIEELLIAKVESLLEQRKKHQEEYFAEIVKRRRRQACFYSRRSRHGSDQPDQRHTVSVKEAATSQYERNYRSRLISGAKKRRSVCNRGSRCLQCLMEYELRKSKTSCRFHPGFVVTETANGNSSWNCCDAPILAHEDQAGCHLKTGCKTKASHTWRRATNNTKKMRISSS